MMHWYLVLCRIQEKIFLKITSDLLLLITKNSHLDFTHFLLKRVVSSTSKSMLGRAGLGRNRAPNNCFFQQAVCWYLTCVRDHLNRLLCTSQDSKSTTKSFNAKLLPYHLPDPSNSTSRR